MGAHKILKVGGAPPPFSSSPPSDLRRCGCGMPLVELLSPKQFYLLTILLSDGGRDPVMYCPPQCVLHSLRPQADRRAHCRVHQPARPPSMRRRRVIAKIQGLSQSITAVQACLTLLALSATTTRRPRVLVRTRICSMTACCPSSTHMHRPVHVTLTHPLTFSSQLILKVTASLTRMQAARHAQSRKVISP